MSVGLEEHARRLFLHCPKIKNKMKFPNLFHSKLSLNFSWENQIFRSIYNLSPRKSLHLSKSTVFQCVINVKKNQSQIVTIALSFCSFLESLEQPLILEPWKSLKLFLCQEHLFRLSLNEKFGTQFNHLPYWKTLHILTRLLDIFNFFHDEYFDLSENFLYYDNIKHNKSERYHKACNVFIRRENVANNVKIKMRRKNPIGIFCLKFLEIFNFLWRKRTFPPPSKNPPIQIPT